MMNDETPEKVARDMIAQADILAMMGPQPLSSLKVIENLKKFAERILNAKPDEHAARMEPQGDSPAESADSAEPEKKAVGNFAGQGKVVSYAICRDMAVTVTATLFDKKMWRFKGIKDGEALIYGHILGGKYQAMQYCKFIRNGIVSRANRVRRGKRNKEVQA